MAEIVREDVAEVDIEGRAYIAHVWGEERDDGQWEGWLEFQPEGENAGDSLATGTETIQPSRESLVRWAATLGEVYFEGAWERAQQAEQALREAEAESDIGRLWPAGR